MPLRSFDKRLKNESRGGRLRRHQPSGEFLIHVDLSVLCTIQSAWRDGKQARRAKRQCNAPDCLTVVPSRQACLLVMRNTSQVGRAA